jgi:hypothetical protein
VSPASMTTCFLTYFSNNTNNRYQLAEDINGQLDQMATNLKDLIQKLNTAHNKNVDTDNPVCTVHKVICFFFQIANCVPNRFHKSSKS